VLDVSIRKAKCKKQEVQTSLEVKGLTGGQTLPSYSASCHHIMPPAPKKKEVKKYMEEQLTSLA